MSGSRSRRRARWCGGCSAPAGRCCPASASGCAAGRASASPCRPLTRRTPGGSPATSPPPLPPAAAPGWHNSHETALPREWRVDDIPRNMDRRVLEDLMTLPTLEEARSWRGLMLVANDDEPVGRIDAVYLDRTTRKPEWVLVNTGLFGSARTFVPLADATKLGDTVRVPHDPRVVREAPRLERDVDLSESDEARLYAHYGIDYTTSVSPSGLPATESGTDATAELPEAAG